MSPDTSSELTPAVAAEPAAVEPAAAEPTPGLFASIVDAVPQLICAFSQQGEYLFLNRAMREFTGAELPTAHGGSFRALVHPEDLSRLEPVWQRAFAQGVVFRSDVRLRDRAGRYHWFDMTSKPTRTDGGPVTWYTSATNVDDRRSLTDDLQLVLDAFPGMIALWDRDLMNRYANVAHKRMFGMTPEQVRGLPMDQVIGAERYADVASYLGTVFAGEAQHFDRELQVGEAAPHHVRVSLSSVVREGELHGLLTVAQDITDMHDATARLFEAEGRFEQAFEQAPLGCALLDLQGGFTRVNPEMARILGAVPAALVGKSLDDLLVGNEATDSAQVRAELLIGGPAHSESERRWRRPDGTVVETRLFKSVVRDRAGRPLYFLLQLEDISERKRADRALQRANAELRRSNEDLERFAYVASHDLQEPLRTIASYTRLLAERYREALDERGQRYIDYAVDAAQRMQQLISGLLDISRLGREDRPSGPVDLNTVVSAVQRLLAKAISTAEATVEGSHLPMVLGHQDQLIRLVQNLMGNALKFTRPGHRPIIRIGAEPEAGGWRFWISDNGPGIAPEYRERVFGMFQRLHTREQVPGNGIGLAVVKRIAELHHGKAWIESSEGGGTKVLVWLPATEQ